MKELEKIVDSNGEPLEIVDAEAREDISEIKQSLSQLDGLVVYRQVIPTGDTASFIASDSMQIIKLESDITPSQDLHGYDAPWAGGAGKNKWEFDSSLSGSGNVLGGKVFTNQIPLGTYTLSCKGTFASGGVMAFRFVYTDNTTKDVTLGYNVQSGTYYVSAVFEKTVRALSYVYSNNADNSINSIQLEQGETATSYAPYSNICPISGWDKVNVTRCGANLCDGIFEQGSITNNGTNSPSTTRCRLVGYMPIKPNATYYCKSDYNTFLFFYDKNKTFIGYYANNVKNSTFKPKDLPNAVSGGDDFSNARYVRFRYDNATFEGNFSINYPSTDTEYHAYNGQTYTIDLDGTRYGGTLDVVSGLLTITDGHIASYNGETLPSTWISDRDVYSEGTTPTTGAQVVYKLASALNYQLTTQQINDLIGQNYIWADTGSIKEVGYLDILHLS